MWPERSAAAACEASPTLSEISFTYPVHKQKQVVRSTTMFCLGISRNNERRSLDYVLLIQALSHDSTPQGESGCSEL